MDHESDSGLPTRRGMLAAGAGFGLAPAVTPGTHSPDQEVITAGISPAAVTHGGAVTNGAIQVLPNGAIRVEVSPQVMYNLNASLRTLTDVLTRAGCQACCSGLSIRFVLQEEAFQTGG
jgi:hypothetical protein